SNEGYSDPESPCKHGSAAQGRGPSARLRAQCPRHSEWKDPARPPHPRRGRQPNVDGELSHLNRAPTALDQTGTDDDHLTPLRPAFSNSNQCERVIVE